MAAQGAGSGSGGAAPPGGGDMVEELAYRRLTGVAMVVSCTLALLLVGVVLNQLLNLQLFAGIVFVENRYLYLLATATLPLVFLSYPARGRRAGHGVPWHDFACAAIALACGLYLVWNSQRILNEGWEYGAPVTAIVVSGIFAVLILEAVRRTGGLAITIIVTVVGLYPIFADKMPGPIAGLPQTLTDTIAYHIVSAESAFGIPMKAFGEIVVGFIVFGVALNYTGGGRFFNDVAFALVGHIRGGAAQVGVVSSALQGSISGSVISNVISSGVVTIPAMKRTGFTAPYAGAVEAVASTGAVLMPPVMGSTAFVMASFLGRSYGEIALAAAIPALLFYFGLMVQIDAYAARAGLRGMRREELPRLWPALREGWVYIAVFAVLVFFMVHETREAMAPFYATGLLLVINQLMPRHRMNGARFLEFLLATGRGLAEIVAILLGVGFIIGAFSVTGLAGTLANDLVYLAGDAPLVLLLMGALTSFIFGMGMTVTACYIFLAIVLAPPLVKAGMDPLAVHLFIMYWGMVSFITPPVALASFAAAGMCGADPWRTSWIAMKLGLATLIVPFMFVFGPELLMRGDWQHIALVSSSALLGVFVLASSTEGWLAGGFAPVWMRVLLFVCAIFLILPEYVTSTIGAAGFATLWFVQRWRRRTAPGVVG
jgi:TRAP transporter 4TM/12TM fusion protein